MVGVAMANYAAPTENGHSVAFDGMAFTRDGRRRDMLLAEGAEGEQLLLARFDLDALRDYREREVWGNAFRRADAYQALVDPSARPPFARRRHGSGS